MTGPDDAPPDAPAGGAPRRRWSVGLAVRLLTFAAVLHFLVLPQIGGTRRALHLLGDLDPSLVVAAVVLEGLALGAYAELTRLLLPVGSRPRFGTMIRIVLSSLSVNHVVPGGAAAGGVVQYRLLTQSGARPVEASMAMATQSIGSALVLNLMLWVGLVVSIPATGFQPLYALAAGVGVVLFTLAGLTVLALTRGRHTTLRAVTRLAERTPAVNATRVAATLERASEQLSALLRRPNVATTASVWAAANWLLDASVLWLFLAAFGHQASIPGLLVAYGLANVLAAIPLSPGGLGVIETTLIVTLVGFGTPRAVASLGVAAYRLVQFWAPIPIGAAAWVSLAGGRWRDALVATTDQTVAAEADDE